MDNKHMENEMTSESLVSSLSIDDQDYSSVEVSGQFDNSAGKSCVRGIAKRFSRRTAQIAYHLIIKRLPGSGFHVLGKLFTRLRRVCAKAIMISCGERVTIEPMAVFSSEC